MKGAKLRNKKTAEMADAVSKDNQQMVQEGNMHNKAAGMYKNNE